MKNYNSFSGQRQRERHSARFRACLAFFLCLSFIVGMIVHNLPTAIAAPIAPHPNTEIVLGTWAGSAADEDGLGGHNPGDDSGPNNLVVRTYDIVQYRIDWNVNEVDGTNVLLKANLPANMDIEWVVDPALPLPPGCKDSGVTPISSISADGKSLVCNLGDHEEGSSGAIFPMMQVYGQLDNDTITINATVETDQSPPVTSNDVTVTISARPKWNWKKDKEPDVYRDVMLNGVAGQIVVYPVYLVPGADNRGSEPMNDTPPMQLFDHLYYWSADASAPLAATLITSANVNNVATSGTAAPYDRACGGYTGNILAPGATITNTTAGAAAGTETVTCVVDATATAANQYPVVQIDISGHDTKSFAEKMAFGNKNSKSIAVSLQVPFFIANSELFPNSSGLGYIHNAISGGTDPIPTPPPAPDVVSTVSQPIMYAGTSANFPEATMLDNLIEESLSYDPATPGPKTFRHLVYLNSGPPQLLEVPDSTTGLPIMGLDRREAPYGGIWRHGLSPTRQGSQAVNNYAFNGEVARGQDFVVTYELSGRQTNVTYQDAHREAIHGCLYIDNTYVDVTEMPTTIDVMQAD